MSGLPSLYCASTITVSIIPGTVIPVLETVPFSRGLPFETSSVQLSRGVPFRDRTIIHGTAIPLPYNSPGERHSCTAQFIPRIAIPVQCNFPRAGARGPGSGVRGPRLPFRYCAIIAGILIPALYNSPRGLRFQYCTIFPGLPFMIPIPYNYSWDNHSRTDTVQLSRGLSFEYCTIIPGIGLPVLYNCPGGLPFLYCNLYPGDCHS
jgi:hypothetical protein